MNLLFEKLFSLNYMRVTSLGILGSNQNYIASIDAEALK